MPRFSGGKMPPETADKMSAPHFKTGSEVTGALTVAPTGRGRGHEQRTQFGARHTQRADEIAGERGPIWNGNTHANLDDDIIKIFKDNRVRLGRPSLGVQRRRRRS